MNSKFQLCTGDPLHGELVRCSVASGLWPEKEDFTMLRVEPQARLYTLSCFAP